MVFFGFFGNGGDQFSWGTTNGDDESQTNSAKTDTDNSATPNNDWGHGKLDVAAGVAYLAANYTTCNMRLLSTLSNQVAMAIDKSLAFQQIHQLKDGLEDQLAGRTSELTHTLVQLHETQAQDG